MASIRNRSGKLFFDFYYQGVRCREQTLLLDTKANRNKLEKVLENIEAQIMLDRFVYRDVFPKSTRCSVFKKYDDQIQTLKETTINKSDLIVVNTLTFEQFAYEWLEESKIHWKLSHYKNVVMIFERYLIPEFGQFRLNEINRTHIIKYRASILEPKRNISVKRKLSNDWINHIMTPLRKMLKEASLRYDFQTPFINIQPLKIPKTKIEPFSLKEVQHFLKHVRADFHNYYTVRFFTAIRTAEIDGLKWEYVNFDRNEITIHETLVDGNTETPKTLASYRNIQLSSVVVDALKEQHKVTGKNTYVFCNSKNKPLDHRNITKRVWYPTLVQLGLKKRRPYQTRHTCATLWLASGENPEWIAKQMGHSTTKMLFEVYSRYVPNNTRQDGSAFDRLLQNVNITSNEV
ncbi:site-specific integrase [Pseudoalteromonas shioyasakiensis]|uniref:Arm DNA-binding domain-containing protein n=1 Tax=Pseudoalteromonas shioyasakiensis TaxID=1190813 RepID=UPI002117B0BF|nr:DUF3596 domain-containing protein [Pseudoalteromonas shioyasakiensis]MCQ8876539.1 site-specific integrase [Pseudoalteromonas shioyasakiensis]